MKHIIEKRLIDLAIAVNNICQKLSTSFMNQHLKAQLIRSSTSAALNYAEAQVAESRKDFIHKLNLVLKELKESKVCMKLLYGSFKDSTIPEFEKQIIECDELIAIIFKTLQTTRKNLLSNK
jgi:four helix bundle protein